MSIRKKEGSMDVVQAARLRIRNVFSNGVPVYMSFSAGKDSLCMSHLVYDQIRRGRIDASQLIVVFIDEGKSIQEIGKQLGMKPEEVFRLSDFTREDFLEMMTRGVSGYSRATLYRKV